MPEVFGTYLPNTYNGLVLKRQNKESVLTCIILPLQVTFQRIIKGKLLFQLLSFET